MGLYKNIALFFSFELIPESLENVDCIIEIIDLKEEKNTLDKYTLKILNSENNEILINKKFITYLDKEFKFMPGDIVYAKCSYEKAEKTRNFYGFNNRNYLKQKEIYGTLEIKKLKYLEVKKDKYYFLGIIKSNILQKIETLYDDKFKDVLSKILFGINSNIDEDITENFRDAGISHVLAISGLHVSYVVVLISFILDKCIINIKVKNILICICLIIFLVLIGMSPSCVRACVMAMIGIISKNIYRKNNVYINIIFSFMVLIFNNFFVVYNVGMWLSFLGTLGIVLFYRFLKLIFKFKRSKIVSKVIDVVLISFSAQILIWPVILYTFNTISLTFFISNIFISYIIGPIVLLGYLSIIFSYFIFPVAKMIAILQEFLLEILFLIADICSKIPFSKIYVPGNKFFSIIVYYITLLLFIYNFNKNKIMLFRFMIFIKDKKIKNKLFSNKGKKIILFVNIFIILFSSVFIFYNFDFKNSNLEIYLVDVGQGDCIIIRTKEKNIIIDSGEGNSKDKYDYGKSVVFQHLLKLGITSIDYMIYTHMDSDHAGGLMYILENMKVKNVIIGIQPEDSENLKSLIKIINKKENTKLSIVESGNKIKIDKDSYIDILWPIKEELILENALNNNSLVFKFYYKDLSILFTGDIEELAEKEIIEKYKNDLNCDILKVAHHGSKTSTTNSFLKYANPKIALIGVGKDNKFSHPSEVVINRLEDIKCKIYRTDIDGEVKIEINQKGKMKIKKAL